MFFAHSFFRIVFFSPFNDLVHLFRPRTHPVDTQPRILVGKHGVRGVVDERLARAGPGVPLKDLAHKARVPLEEDEASIVNVSQLKRFIKLNCYLPQGNAFHKPLQSNT